MPEISAITGPVTGVADGLTQTADAAKGSTVKPFVPLADDEEDSIVHLYLKLGTNMNALPTPHKWSMQERIEAFHICLKQADADWPFAVGLYDRDIEGNYTANEVCEDCGGCVYCAPVISPAEIITLAKQFGLVIEKMKYLREKDCKVLVSIKANSKELYADIEQDNKDVDKLIEEVLTLPFAETIEEAVPAKAEVAHSAAGYVACGSRSWEDSTDVERWQCGMF